MNMANLNSNLPVIPGQTPITGMCFVSELSACPNGFLPISRTQDTNEDADVWKDSFFRKKVTRYLCVSQQFSEINPNRVLVDLAVIGENDQMPSEFVRMDSTFDTGEKPLKKRVLCSKFLPKDTTNDAITEVILLAKMKRPPTGYTLIGDINHLAICTKMGPVPKEMNTSQQTQQPGSMPPSYMSRPPTYSMDSQIQQQNRANLPYALPGTAVRTETSMNQGQSDVLVNVHPGYGLLQKQSSTLGRAILSSPLAGIPFEVNSKFKEDSSFLKSLQLPEMPLRSGIDIENQFEYPFRVEKQASQRLPPDVE